MLDTTCDTLLQSIPSFESNFCQMAGKDIAFNQIGDTGDLAQTTYTLQILVDVLVHGGQALATHISSTRAPSPWTTLCEDRGKSLLADDLCYSLNILFYLSHDLPGHDNPYGI
jgi:hypothetical protein